MAVLKFEINIIFQKLSSQRQSREGSVINSFIKVMSLQDTDLQGTILPTSFPGESFREVLRSKVLTGRWQRRKQVRTTYHKKNENVTMKLITLCA